MVTFEEINKEGNIDVVVKKAGLSLAANFSKEFIARFDLKYGDIIRLNKAEIVRQEKAKSI